MNLEEMKRKYAYTLARVGLNVQKGQTVLVEAAIEGSAFTPVFCEECYKLGASNVVVHYLDQANLKVASLYRSKEDVEKSRRLGKFYRIKNILMKVHVMYVLKE